MFSFQLNDLGLLYRVNMIYKKQRISLLAILCVMTLISSCTITRNQQVEMTWNQPTGNSPISFVAADNSILMEYNMWNNNGILQTTVTNYTDSILIIDLKTSRFEVNGFSRAYNNPDWMVDETKFDMTAGDENDYILIDPKSSRTLTLFTLNAYLKLEYNTQKAPRKDSLFFDSNNSPLKATNHLIYAKGFSEWQSLDHSFHLNKITAWTKGNAVELNNNDKKSRFYVTDRRPSGGVLAIVSLSLIVLFVISGG